MRRVGFLVFEGVTLLDVTGPAEVFSRAPGYELVMFSPAGGDVPVTAGFTVADTLPATRAAAAGLDTVIVPGSDAPPGQPWDRELLDAAAALTDGPPRVASVCTGAFILAELGLLDGRRATTHWRSARDLARRYPRVRVEPDMLHVHDGRFLSSAGATAGIDLALSLVEEDHGAPAARSIAQEMVVFMQRPGGQSQFAGTQNAPTVDSPVLRDVLDRVRCDPAAPHSAVTMAEEAAVSTRHLGRLFREELGTTPARWLEQLRLSTAQQLILDGHTVTAAARHSGFGSDENLRRAFERHLQATPSEYRNRFSSAFRR